MNILKVININEYNVMDYKGLDIDFFVPGSQFYYKGKQKEECLLKTVEDLTDFKHNDVIEITEEEYWEIIESYKSEQAQPELTEEQKKIAYLEKDNINNMKAMIELHAKIMQLEGKI